ncbi:regulator of microtubule dynamics protein 1-like [Anopheles ziemanni]|uniref:regulator of microtubule dynamics protein 1-like n=1 Tax=Anopheles coustani TaxID=139045 RepID=UPI00265882DC|nr:regulator of microtubule dynamics protein 1-like [Anopheles coustani]XP_058173374.1 regulator of microtubule dynamics protein 1-like [Anopheles ziemanni]
MEDVLKQSDQLFDAYKFRESYDLLLKQTDRSYEILWRLCRVIYSLSREFVDDASKSKQLEALIFEGFDYSKKAFELAPERSAAHKYYAIFLAEKSGIDGLKERVLQLSTILKHLKKATELDAQDPFAWFVLGRFYHKLASLPWFQKKMIHTFTIDVPEATFEDALQCFEKAENVAPNFFPLNHLMLGETYIALKNGTKARHFLELAANQTAPHTADDREAQKTAKALLKKL